MMNKRTIALFAVVCILAAAVAGLYVMKTKKPGTPGGGTTTKPEAVSSVAHQTKDPGKKTGAKHDKTGDKKSSAVKKSAVKKIVEPEEELDEVDRITKPLDDAMEGDDNAAILAQAKLLMKHPNPEVRKQVVFALDWVGLEALDLITAMLGDADPDVSSEVLNTWSSTISEISDQTAKRNLIAQAIISQQEVLSDEAFEELTDTAGFELDEPDDLWAYITVLQYTDEGNVKRMEILRDAINGILDEEVNTKQELLKSGQETYDRLLKEKQEEEADDNDNA